MKVLLVEDDEALASGLTLALDNAGVLVEVAGDGRSADFLVSTERYDAIILDLGLPDGNGTQWLSAWRDRGIELPVLILTARDRWSDKAAGFSAGADDYVTKPFETAEILFRLRALVRRAHGHAHPVIRVGDISLDTHSAQVTRAGMPVTLTAQEFRLLSHLVHAAPRVVSRSELTEHVYDGDAEPDSNVIDVQVSRLRRKLGSHSIETLRGQGYRMIAGAQAR
ncbi:response regulator transcription factor [Marinobacter sp. M3C]|jgi:two-component system OmpR family response regulator|uniref:winged helix-turn-helix domain-containing protein n=1 Tax=Marinobacter sp. M3C TaxID=2917715 RepID=UPI00200FE0E4|nr:response regulator transcription factor [Marinobacter sp. M3C]MCL1477446.1 response regulator transcription factor [Marinobacter sp.]MCL1486068.1 response regulator transcription factor [Marinobacter sp.]UQG59509.1 response regulator transcription factor [Marinobacter sp. M3C]